MSKKGFTDADAVMDILGGSAQAEPAKTEAQPIGAKIPEGYKIVIAEKRTRRVGFVMAPSDYERMESYCRAAHISVSEFINQAISRAMEA